MREIVFDTETTGLDPASGDRLVEFAGIELRDRIPTGAALHFYVNPERDMPAEAEAVHGLSAEFLRDKPLFADKAAELLQFFGDSPIVAHNAGFDLRFLDAELGRAGLPRLDAARVVDTLDLARRRFPGAKHSLDALCQRFGIDRSARVVHGALIDAELLAEVYVELMGGRQMGLDLAASGPVQEASVRRSWPRRHFQLSEADRAAHEAFLDGMANPRWRSDATGGE